MNKIKKIVFPLFIASITLLASTTHGCIYYGGGSGSGYDSGTYDKIKKDFYTKDVTKDHSSCKKKCESLNMWVDSFDKGIICSCTY